MAMLTATPLSGPAAPVTVVSQAAGTTLANPDGTVVSIQPDGRRQTRPAGTAGPYELCKLAGSLAVYTPTPETVWFYGFSQ